MTRVVDSALNSLLRRLSQPAAQGTYIFVAIYTFLWGCWLLAFDTFNSSPVYDWLSKVAPEVTFGWAAIATGAAMAATVLRNTFPVTAYGALLGFVFWGLIGVGYLAGSVNSTGALTALWLSMYSAFVYLNIRFNQKEGK